MGVKEETMQPVEPIIHAGASSYKPERAHLSINYKSKKLADNLYFGCIKTK